MPVSTEARWKSHTLGNSSGNLPRPYSTKRLPDCNAMNAVRTVLGITILIQKLIPYCSCGSPSGESWTPHDRSNRRGPERLVKGVLAFLVPGSQVCTAAPGQLLRRGVRVPADPRNWPRASCGRYQGPWGRHHQRSLCTVL